MYSIFSLRGKLTYLSAALLGLLLAIPAAAQAPFDPPGLDRAIAAQDFHADGLMATDGVVGVGVGLTARGQAAIVIMTEDLWVTGFPRSLDGVPVRVKVTGKIHAINKPPHDHGNTEEPSPSGDPCDSDTTAKCDRPVFIGVSTGNVGSCSAGTIGARVTDTDADGNVRGVYVLSNNHVYALENDAPLGSDVLQPGLLDTNCDVDLANDVIGKLFAFVKIIFCTPTNCNNNDIDAAIAVVDVEMIDGTPIPKVGTSTPLDGYGTPSSVTVSANLLELSVQKYGRTTGLTEGTITMTNVILKVGYSSGIARFVDQIIVESIKPFIKAGDSGSLLVTNDQWANPVGLLFAGNRSGKLAVANNIDVVLNGLEGTLDAGRARQELVGFALGTANIDGTPPSP